MSGTPDTRPLVHGFIDRGDRLCVWCSWCCDWHRHGHAADEPPGSTTHRMSHCTAPGGPYWDLGYRILVHSTPAEDVMSIMKKAGAGQTYAMKEGRTTPVVDRLRAQEVPAHLLGA